MNICTLKKFFLCSLISRTFSANCFWTFRPISDDFTRGLLSINVQNPLDEAVEYNQKVVCPTLKIQNFQTINSTLTVKAKENQQLPVIVQILPTFSLTIHTCNLRQWPKNNPSQLTSCNITVYTYKGDAFLIPCNKTNKVKSELKTSVNHAGISVYLKNFGEPTSYTAKITCVPYLNLIYDGFYYKTIFNQSIWQINLLPNCSKALDANYMGKCELNFYLLCQEFPLVQKFSYLYNEGNVDNCRHLIDELNFNTSFPVVIFVIGFSCIALMVILALKYYRFASKMDAFEARRNLKVQLVNAFTWCCKKTKPTKISSTN